MWNVEIPSVEIVRLPAHCAAPKPLFKAAKRRNISTAGFATRYLGKLGRHNALGAGRNYGNKGAHDAAERKTACVLDGVGLWNDCQCERCHARQRGCCHGEWEQGLCNTSGNALFCVPAVKVNSRAATSKHILQHIPGRFAPRCPSIARAATPFLGGTRCEFGFFRTVFVLI
jgi:hypothetical protein